MPLPDLQTIALLLIAFSTIGTLLLMKQMRRDKQTVHISELHNNIDMSKVVAWLDEHVQFQPQDLADRLDRIEQAISADGKKTRKDIQETKTALRDDEKQQQREKATARRKKAKA
jgi:hypothetical protein